MAGETVHLQREGGVGVLTLDHPVANTLGPEIRVALRDRLTEALEDSALQALVLCGAGAGFCAGRDMADHDRKADAPGVPSVADLARRIEDSPKPVIAALHGYALGAGAELALAAHARVAQRGTRLGFPEIRLDLPPEAGATQRLPRVLGAQISLELLLSGRAVAIEEPGLGALVSEIVDAPPRTTALALAQRLAGQGAAVPTRRRRRGFSDPAAYQRAIAEARQQIGERDGAAADILRAVEAAPLLPPEQGLDLEALLREERRDTPASRAARHLAVAERRARRLPCGGTAEPAPLSRIALPQIGARMQALADLLRRAGADVTPDPAAKDAELAILAAGAVSEGTPHVALDDGTGAPPDPGTGVATLRLHTGRGKLRLAELGLPAGVQTIGDADQAVLRLARSLQRGGTVTVLAGTVPLAPGRMLEAARDLAALALMTAGAAPEALAQAARDLGLATDPLAQMRAEGASDVRARLGPLIADLGVPRETRLAPLAALLAPGGARVGADAALGAADLRAALHGAMVNAAARLIRAGTIARPSDIDLVAVHGPGFRRDRGGPLMMADLDGLLTLERTLTRLAPLLDPVLFAPDPLLREHLLNGAGFHGQMRG